MHQAPEDRFIIEAGDVLSFLDPDFHLKKRTMRFHFGKSFYLELIAHPQNLIGIFSYLELHFISIQ